MKTYNIFWLILGIILFLSGILAMGSSMIIGIILFVTGLIFLIMISFSMMKRSGAAKADYFFVGGCASPKIELETAVTEVPADIWDRMTGDKEEER